MNLVASSFWRLLGGTSYTSLNLSFAPLTCAKRCQTEVLEAAKVRSIVWEGGEKAQASREMDVLFYLHLFDILSPPLTK